MRLFNLLLVGNSGYETATNLVGAAAFIHLGSRHRMKQAHQTHYVGDLRAINNQLVDTYQLKSLDAFMSTPCCHGVMSLRNKVQTCSLIYCICSCTAFDFDTDKRVGLKKNEAGEYEICFQPNETASMSCENAFYICLFTWTHNYIHSKITSTWFVHHCYTSACHSAGDNSIEARTAVYDRVLLCTGFKVEEYWSLQHHNDTKYTYLITNYSYYR